VTLRLVSEDERYVVPCHYGCGPATILVIINETPPIPCCDKCGRRLYEMDPRYARLAPMSEYVDLYAAAKKAATATPEQVAGNTQPDDDDGIYRRMYEDQVLYCCGSPCTQSGRLTPAGFFIFPDGQQWTLACGACVHQAHANGDPQARSYPLDEGKKTQVLAKINEIAGGRGWTRAGDDKPAASTPGARQSGSKSTGNAGLAWLIGGIASLASIILGSMMVHLGNAGGLFFIGLPFGILAIVFLGWIIASLPEEIRRDKERFERVERQIWEAEQQGIPMGRMVTDELLARQGIRVGQVGTTAALYGAWGLAEHERHERHAQARAALQAKSAAYKQQQYQQELLGTQQAILDQLQQQNAPAPPARRSLTPQSDIYGNVTYRDRNPWP